MSSQTFIFIGRSGCGKGTQAALLETAIKERDIKTPIIHLETGALFREFFKGSSYSHRLAHDVYKRGGLQPEFLTVHLWSTFFVKNMKEKAHLIIDGTPRKIHEAHVLDTALGFYARNLPTVIYINVSREWASDRLTARHREDDTKKDIEARLDWFDTDVVPALDFYRKNPDYRFVEINGERPIEEIHDDIARQVLR
jgi:adenylate kinase